MPEKLEYGKSQAVATFSPSPYLFCLQLRFCGGPELYTPQLGCCLYSTGYYLLGQDARTPNVPPCLVYLLVEHHVRCAKASLTHGTEGESSINSEPMALLCPRSLHQ
jgi:hypothetical protein